MSNYLAIKEQLFNLMWQYENLMETDPKLPNLDDFIIEVFAEYTDDINLQTGGTGSESESKSEYERKEWAREQEAIEIIENVLRKPIAQQIIQNYNQDGKFLIEMQDFEKRVKLTDDLNDLLDQQLKPNQLQFVRQFGRILVIAVAAKILK